MYGSPVRPVDRKTLPKQKQYALPIPKKRLKTRGSWKPGQSGNPKGRPPGVISFAVKLREAVEKWRGDGDVSFFDMVIEMAAERDAVMCKLLDKILASASPEHMNVIVNSFEAALMRKAEDGPTTTKASPESVNRLSSFLKEVGEGSRS